MTRGSIDNLRRLFLAADRIDEREGMLAYQRYHAVMRAIGEHFGIPLPDVIAAFVTLSPNNDYVGNLRSLVTVLQAWVTDIDPKFVTISGYNHCKLRAFAYLEGHKQFLRDNTGLKVLNFYHNLLNPDDPSWVTVDGHMSAAWQGNDQLTMREALLRTKSEYHEIASALKTIAAEYSILPNQAQSIIWFTRKRIARRLFRPQIDAFDWARNDVWRTVIRVEDIKMFPFKKANRK